MVQGTTEEMYVTLTEDAPADGNLGDWALHFRKLGPDMVALQGLPGMATPGLVPFSVTVQLPGEIQLRSSRMCPWWLETTPSIRR